MNRINPPFLVIEQRQSCTIQPYNYLSSCCHDMAYSLGVSISAISQQDVSGPHWKSLPGLAPTGIGKLEKIALQVGQIEAIVNPPVGPRAARFHNRCRIHRAYALL